MDDDPKLRPPLHDLIAGVLKRLETGEAASSHPHEFSRELARLRDELVRTQPTPSIESFRESSSTDIPESATRQDASPSSELIARLAAHAPSESRYRIDGEIARGGMGAILKAFDPNLRRTLAMKVALERPSDDAKQRERVARFLDEAQITGQLDHPGIVPVHELGLDSKGRFYFTMRLVRGRHLGAVYQQAQDGEAGWSTTRVLGVLLKVCEAMAYAHSKGVIHRDLKPANVMVGSFGEVYVMDWGLAKVVGLPDAHDLRVNAPPSTSASSLKSIRFEERVIDPDTPLITRDGTVIGTPAYMSPEQASGANDAMDARSDVYALGAMLYQLLAGHAPYQDEGEKGGAHSVWLRILSSPPTPLAVRAPNTPPELVAITERAMARDVVHRYADMQAFADDLRAFLEGRVVGAYESGAWAEARKWVTRNRALAGSMATGVVVLIAGVVTSALYADKAQSKSLEAQRNAQTANANEARAIEQERLATARAEDVLALSAIQDVLDIEARADELWPAHPALVPEYERWLGDARNLIEGVPADPTRGLKQRPSLAEHRSKLSELCARALPQTEEQRLADRASHPRLREFEELRHDLIWHSRMLGLEPWPAESDVEAQLAHESLPTDYPNLNARAWELADPDKSARGEEMRAVLLARRSLAAASQVQEGAARHTLAWALFKVGRLEDAAAEARLAYERSDERRSLYTAALERLAKALESWRGADALRERRLERDQLARRVEMLEREVDARRTWDFVDVQDRWWRAQLSQLVASLEALEDAERGLINGSVAPPHGWGISRRYEFARSIEESSTTGARAAALWNDAIASIASSPRYVGLQVQPQLGLLPLGPDPASGLWEFAHVQTGEPAERGPNGELHISERTGLVFVLIPAGSFQMGAQWNDANVANYDPLAQSDEAPVHEVKLSPFFLSKYEMTQGQWLRATGLNPSHYGPGDMSPGLSHDERDPVEQVSWLDCELVLRRLALVLPTEAQWEFAYRAGTDTPWPTGADPDSLRGYANLADISAARAGVKQAGPDDWVDFDDGWPRHCPVGAILANAWGFHEMVGNVGEWCRDGFDSRYYFNSPLSDPLAPPVDRLIRVARGATYNSSLKLARSAERTLVNENSVHASLGVRPARLVTP